MQESIKRLRGLLGVPCMHGPHDEIRQTITSTPDRKAPQPVTILEGQSTAMEDDHLHR